MDSVNIINIIATNCRTLSVGLTVFSVNLWLQAAVTINQTQMMTIKNQNFLLKKIHIVKYIAIFLGAALIIGGIASYAIWGMNGENWLTIGYALIIAAGSLITWEGKLNTTDYEKYGRLIKRWACAIVGFTTLLILINIALTS